MKSLKTLLITAFVVFSPISENAFSREGDSSSPSTNFDKRRGDGNNGGRRVRPRDGQGNRGNGDRNRNGNVNRDRNRNGNNNGGRVDRDRRDRNRDGDRAYRRRHMRRDWDFNTRRDHARRDYRRYTHRPNRDYRNHNTRWSNSRDYFRAVDRRYVYRNFWLRVVLNVFDGYHWHNQYPFYVYRGVAHRYSHFDNCNYELVDSYTDRTYDTFYNYSCATGYDLCADLRDELNDYEYGYRYFCSERSDVYYDSDYDYYNDDYLDYDYY